jgi:hypothetical protein
MASKTVAMPAFGWLIWGFMLGLAMPYGAVLLHFGLAVSDWTPFGFEARIWIARLLLLALIAFFLIMTVRSALRHSHAASAKSLTGFIALLLGIGCIGLGLFLAIKLNLTPGAPRYI